ncbi:MAG: hypothetical protein LBR69_03925 [Endomicrobium sp.]|nr:hypothetical protein [Endomicrobium sp.]
MNNGSALASSSTVALSEPAVMNINHSTGALNVNGRISGAGTINKTGEGDLNLTGDNSRFRGIFNQSSGTTNLSSGTFFGGESYISSGTLNLNNGSELSALSMIMLSSPAVMNANTSSGNALGINGQIRGEGTFNKTGEGELNLIGNNMNFTGAFNQSAGTTNVNGIFFGGASNISSGTLNMNNGSEFSNTGTIALSSNAAMNLTHTAGNELSLNGRVSGDGAVNKTGDGTLNLTGDNSVLTGTFTQTAGTTNVSSGTFFGGKSNISSGTVNFNNESALSSSGTVALSTPAVMNINNSTGSFAINGGQVSGSGALNKTGNGTLDLAGDNSVLKGTFTQTAGTTNVSSGTFFGGKSNISSGTLNMNDGSALASSSTVALSTPAVMNINNSTGSFAINGGQISGSGAVNKTGDGTLDLAGDNSVLKGTFTQTAGTTNISSGTFFAGRSNINDGTLNFNDGSKLASSSTVTLSTPAVMNINHSSTSFEVNGQVSGTGTVNKTSSGTLNLTGNNSRFTGSYNQSTGTTNVSSGTMFGGRSNINGGVLNMNNGSSLVSGSTVTLSTPAVMNVNNSTGALNVNGQINGTGTVNKTSSGALNLTGDNSRFTGAFNQSSGTTNVSSGTMFAGRSTISSGTLNFNNGSALSSSGTVALGTSAVMNVNNSTGSFAINGGQASGNGAINKTGEGTLNLTGNNSVLTGTFTQTAGTTNVSSGSFLGGASTINNGTINFNAGSSLVPASRLLLNTPAIMNITQSTGVFNIAGQVSGTGTINKTAGSTLNLTGNNSNFTGTFNQSTGTTIVGANDRMFGGTNNINGGNLQVTSRDVHYDANIGSSASLTHMSVSTGSVDLSGLIMKFSGTGGSMTFTNAPAVSTAAARYTLNSKIDNGSDNTVTFRNSVLRLGSTDFTGSTQYNLENVNLDLRNNLLQTTSFTNLRVGSGSKLLFDIDLETMLSDRLTISAPAGQTIDIAGIRLLSLNGSSTTYTFDVLNGITFSGIIDSSSTLITTNVYQYAVSASGTRLTLTANGFAQSNNSLAIQTSSTTGDRSFDFGVYNSNPQYEGNNDAVVYKNNSALNAVSEGTLSIVGRSLEDPGASVIDGGLNGGGYGTLFNMDKAANLVTKDITIQNVKTSSADGGVLNIRHSSATATLENTTVTGNEGRRGGAIYNDDSVLRIADSRFTNNQASDRGGAIYNSGVLFLTAGDKGIVFSSNTAAGRANDIYNEGTVYINGAGTVTVNSGFSGVAGEIELSSGPAGRAGTLNLAGSNDGYTGIFNQKGGTVSVSSGTFFGGESNIFEGNLNFNNGSSLASSAAIILSTPAVVNIAQSTGTFDVRGQIRGAGTINKTDSGTLSLGGDNSNFTGAFNQSSGTTVSSGTLFNSAMSINGGVLELTDGAAAAQNTVINTGPEGVLNITNSTASVVRLSSSNITGSGTINKTGSGVFNLSGDNSGYSGIFTQSSGTTLVEAGSKLFGTNSNENIIKGGDLRIHARDSGDFNQYVTLDGGQLTFMSQTNSALGIDKSNFGNIVVLSTGSTTTFGSAEGNPSSKYRLNENLTAPGNTNTVVGFKDSEVMLGVRDYTGSTTYSFTNSVLNLSSSVATSGTVADFTFGNVLFDSSTKVNLDIDIQNSSATADTVRSSNTARVDLGLISFHHSADNDPVGTRYSVNVLNGGLTFANTKIVTYATGLDTYAVRASSGSGDITVILRAKATAHTLYEFNGTPETPERVFSLSAITDPQYTYYIDSSLGNTSSGTFTVAGKGAQASAISGALVNSSGTFTGENGSFFKLVDTAGTTALAIQDITIRNARAAGITDTGSGSVLYQSNGSTVTLKNVVISSNTSASSGGAINNQKGNVEVSGSAVFGNNTVQRGSGGAIFNGDNLSLVAGADQAITFTGNTANGRANDIHNAGRLTVSGAGAVNIGGGISGSGSIDKSGPGTLNINGNSSDFTGRFIQTGGTTSVTAAFFTGDNVIRDGGLVFSGSGSQTGGMIAIENGTVQLNDNSSLSRAIVNQNGGRVTLAGSSHADNTDFDISDGIMSIGTNASITGNSRIVQYGGTVNIAGSLNDNMDAMQFAGNLNFQNGASFNGGRLWLRGGTAQFDSGSRFERGTIENTGGEILWNGATKNTGMTLLSSGGILHVLNTSTLTLNNAGDIVEANTQIIVDKRATILNLAGNLTVNALDSIEGWIVNGSIVTFDDWDMDYSRPYDPYNQTISTNAQLNIINGSNIRTGINSAITLGTINVGNSVSTDSWLTIGAGGPDSVSGAIGSSVTVNVYSGNFFIVDGGIATLSSGTLNGTARLISGTLNTAGIVNNGLFTATGGNLNMQSGVLSLLSSGSVIEAAVNANIGRNAELRISSGAAAVLNAGDIWNGKVNILNGGRITLNAFTYDGSGAFEMSGGTLTMQNNTNFTMPGNAVLESGSNIEVLNSVINIPASSSFNSFGRLSMNNGTLSTMNGAIGKYRINTLNVEGTANFAVDIHGDPVNFDGFDIGNLTGTGNINISNFNVLSAPTQLSTTLHIFNAPDYGRITFTQTAGVIHTGIFDYNLVPGSNGNYTITRSGNDTQDLNLQVSRGQASTLAAYRNQQAFTSMIFDHVYLDSADSAHGSFRPWQFRERGGGVWIKPYASFGKFSMGGIFGSIDNNSYGAAAGIDLPALKMKNGWKFLPTLFGAYNGSEQSHSGVYTKQYGNQTGFVGSMSKDNFIVSGMGYFGSYQADMNVAGFNDNIDNWFFGFAAKASYNFVLSKNFALQPSLLASFNSYGKQTWRSGFGNVNFETGHIHGYNIEPALAFVYKQPKWNGYGEISYIGNSNGSITGRADDILLPKTDAGAGYFKYSLGAAKDLSNAFSLNGAAIVESGNGVESIGVQMGMTWKY